LNKKEHDNAIHENIQSFCSSRFTTGTSCCFYYFSLEPKRHFAAAADDLSDVLFIPTMMTDEYDYDDDEPYDGSEGHYYPKREECTKTMKSTRA